MNLRYLNLLNEFIDDRIGLYGLENTMVFMLDCGLNYDDLIALNFDEEDAKNGVEAYERWVGENGF